MQTRFDQFSDYEQGVLSTALFIAIEQWEKDKQTVPELAPNFQRSIEAAKKFKEEIGY